MATADIPPSRTRGIRPFAQQNMYPTMAHRRPSSAAESACWAAGPWVSYKRHRMKGPTRPLHQEAERGTSALHRCRTFDRTSAATLWAAARRPQSQPMDRHGQLPYRCNRQTPCPADSDRRATGLARLNSPTIRWRRSSCRICLSCKRPTFLSHIVLVSLRIIHICPHVQSVRERQIPGEQGFRSRGLLSSYEPC